MFQKLIAALKPHPEQTRFEEPKLDSGGRQQQGAAPSSASHYPAVHSSKAPPPRTAAGSDGTPDRQPRGAAEGPAAAPTPQPCVGQQSYAMCTALSSRRQPSSMLRPQTHRHQGTEGTAGLTSGLKAASCRAVLPGCPARRHPTCASKAASPRPVYPQSPAHQ